MAKNLNDITPDLKLFINKHRSKKVMGGIANKGKELIFTRTRTAGTDSNDQKLKPLKPSTIAAKIRKGRAQPKKSRLTDSKGMLDSMASVGRTGLGIIFFKSSAMSDRARYNEEKGRVFFDISPKDERKLGQHIRDIYRKLLNLEI